MTPSSSDFVYVRGLRYHVRSWGDPGAPALFLLHGWMDISASFQFVADILCRRWRVIAPDWRGFGLSAWQRAPYWFPDYLADLDVLLDHYSLHEPARLVGHSMGGNIACLYGGVRPERVARIATLEGFGLDPIEPAEAPARYRKWLEQLQGAAWFKNYGTREELARRLQRDNPRLDGEKAAFLARHFGIEGEDGRIEIAGDPYHKLVNPVLYRLEEAKACWRAVTAPVLWVAARDSFVMKRFRGREDDYRARLACFRRAREVVLEDCSHMMHHDKPEELGAVLEDFLDEA
jgi:pimeloyl-ACP methyl ester carboxylesterase